MNILNENGGKKPRALLLPETRPVTKKKDDATK